MRILWMFLSMGFLNPAGFAQGIVNFANSPSTLVSYSGQGGTGLISGTNRWYFGLLTSGSGTIGSFVFSGIYATNSALAPGRFVNDGVAVPNWPAGTRQWFRVAGWHTSLGPTFDPNWLNIAPPGPFSISDVGSGVAGGSDSLGRPLPPLPLFGGTGISSGFVICCIPGLWMLSHDSGFGVIQNQFGFNITGLAGIPLVIEVCTSFSPPQSWLPVQTCTLTNGIIHFSDPQWGNYPVRFYRVRSY